MQGQEAATGWTDEQRATHEAAMAALRRRELEKRIDAHWKNVELLQKRLPALNNEDRKRALTTIANIKRQADALVILSGSEAAA